MTMVSDEAPHILVVDDDRRIRELLRSYLSEQGFRITTAANSAEARERMAGLAFDLMVVDVMMPGETGLELTRSLRERTDVPILILSALSETSDRIEGLASGSDDYLPKPFEPEELVLRIRSILRRKAPARPAASEIVLGDCIFNVERGELQRSGETVKLTTRERDLLRMFAARPGETISRAELAGNGAGDNARAVDVQINRLRRKLERDPATPVYLQTVRGAGYILYTD
ncbi:response regulator transcription factor [Kaustia mangrovi]|uniref:Response regulator transcription factor n=1 Tax=Kaustia mangrovi TaxID=2593653 RepID=A0A7S8HEH2_9HYPH|nr:response regulator transcription factor [Kaustia mangrovi]QPC45388.1 response regulator transcription factor [Kaustia mangrovi]